MIDSSLTFYHQSNVYSLFILKFLGFFSFFFANLFSMTHVILEHVNAILSRKAAFIILILFAGHREITFLFNLPREVSGK